MQGQLAAHDRWGYLTTTSRDLGCAYLVTLRRFDSVDPCMVVFDPLIPCERRLSKTEIPEFQELTLRARFGNRDYDRPYAHILATLSLSD